MALLTPRELLIPPYCLLGFHHRTRRPRAAKNSNNVNDPSLKLADTRIWPSHIRISFTSRTRHPHKTQYDTR